MQDIWMKTGDGRLDAWSEWSKQNGLAKSDQEPFTVPFA